MYTNATECSCVCVCTISPLCMVKDVEANLLLIKCFTYKFQDLNSQHYKSPFTYMYETFTFIKYFCQEPERNEGRTRQNPCMLQKKTNKQLTLDYTYLDNKISHHICYNILLAHTQALAGIHTLLQNILNTTFLY